MQKQKGPVLISKFGKPLGFKGANASGEKNLAKTKGSGFDPGRFKTQHKG